MLLNLTFISKGLLIMEEIKSADSVHPLFGIFEQTSQQYDLIYSDHLPIFTKVPVDQNDDIYIQLLSYNVMGKNASNNITREQEDENKAILRYKRIALGLKKCADNLELNIDIILLQEVTSKLMVKQLSETLGDGWYIQPSVEEIEKTEYPPEILTCYRKTMLSVVDLPENIHISKPDLYHHCKYEHTKKTLSSCFKYEKSQKIIHIHNTWTNYNIFPNKTEEYYASLLMDKKEGEISIVLGDTNSRIAPLNNKQKNLTTGIIPFLFNIDYGINENNIQLPDHPDGGFYSSNEKIYQLEHCVIDIVEGKKFTENNTNNYCASQKDFCGYRAILCLDDFYKKTPVIQNKTLFEYELQLKNELGDNSVVVRMTSTTYNEKGIFIRFCGKSNYYNILYGVFKKEEVFQFKKLTDNKIFSCVFVPIEQAHVLAGTINDIYEIKQSNNNIQDDEIIKKIQIKISYLGNSNSKASMLGLNKMASYHPNNNNQIENTGNEYSGVDRYKKSGDPDKQTCILS